MLGQFAASSEQQSIPDIGGWECGLFTVQFVEEAVRQCRDELVIRAPVQCSTIIARVNKFTSMVQSAQGKAHKSSVDTVPNDMLDIDSLPLQDLQRLAEETVGSCGPVDHVSDLPATVSRPVAEPVLEKPSALPQLTWEQAQGARQECSKCRFNGCSHCMGQWFIPAKVLQ